jgi:uncharacterized membrane protein YqhA
MQRILNFAIILVVLFTFINALVFFGLGIFYSGEAYYEIATGHMDQLPGIKIIESLDRFLIGFVFIIFSIGFSKLFLSETPFLKQYDLPWLKLTDFHQLKILLVSAILVALFVAWAPYILKLTQEGVQLDWTILLFPACLLIMAGAAKLIKDLH